MKAKPNTTIAELMKKFPNGFSVGPGTPERPGTLGKIIGATSHLSRIVSKWNCLTGNKAYLIIDIDIDDE